ncbi:ribosomal protein S8e/ribosomal biogenesis NSA2 [Globomyces pollinis-pini]|nr:ribosomal protein S8e/ribosomal biogenesis NSA2 [Globomyces pollinis-pini]
MGRQAANTKIGGKRVTVIRVRGGNTKYRALRLDSGNFSWGSQATTSKARIVRVVYNASNNELVRTNTLVKGCIVEIDAVPFRQWFERHYAVPISKKKNAELENAAEKKSNHVQRKLDARKGDSKVETELANQITAGRVLARLASRPGQSGRADGYILEGKELEFYLRKLRSRKA